MIKLVIFSLDSGKGSQGLVRLRDLSSIVGVVIGVSTIRLISWFFSNNLVPITGVGPDYVFSAVVRGFSIRTTVDSENILLYFISGVSFIVCLTTVMRFLIFCSIRL